MPNYIDGSTRRIAQMTGDADPEGLVHYNYTGQWGVQGVDLGASTVHGDRTYIFFGDVPRGAEMLARPIMPTRWRTLRMFQSLPVPI